MEQVRTVWKGEIRGHRIDVSHPEGEEGTPASATTELQPHHLLVTVDGQEADEGVLQEFMAGDDDQSSSLRQAVERLHAR